MKPNFKKILILGSIVLVSIACYVIYTYYKKQHEVSKLPIDVALDSAAYYRDKVIKTDIDLNEAKQKLKVHENNIDSLSRDMANDSFAMAIRRSVLRSRIKADILRSEVPDSIGRQHP